jgi:hypothetical protein
MSGLESSTVVYSIPVKRPRRTRGYARLANWNLTPLQSFKEGSIPLGQGWPENLPLRDNGAEAFFGRVHFDDHYRTKCPGARALYPAYDWSGRNRNVLDVLASGREHHLAQFLFAPPFLNRAAFSLNANNPIVRAPNRAPDARCEELRQRRFRAPKCPRALGGTRILAARRRAK